jgi:hypothetical protein
MTPKITLVEPKQLESAARSLRLIPGDPTDRIAKEVELFIKLSDVDPEMAAVRAQRFADVAARYIFSRRIGKAGTLTPVEMIQALQRYEHIPANVASALEQAHLLGDVASKDALHDSSSSVTISPHEIRACATAVHDSTRWIIEHANTLGLVEDPENTEVIPDVDLTFDDVLRCRPIDVQAYGSNDAAYVADEDILRSWYLACSDIWTILADRSTNEIVGYINAMPVNKETFDLIRGGKFQEGEFGIENFEPYTRPGFYYLYFCSIAIREDRRTIGNLRKLLDGFMEKLWRLSHQNIFIREIIADAVTTDGVQLCESFGMRQIGSSDRSSSLYGIQTMPPKFKIVTHSTRKLVDRYDSIYRVLQKKAQTQPSPGVAPRRR